MQLWCCIDGINEQTRVCKEAYSSLNFSGSLGKNHQVKFDHCQIIVTLDHDTLVRSFIPSILIWNKMSTAIEIQTENTVNQMVHGPCGSPCCWRLAH
jgi:hypothetical protein